MKQSILSKFLFVTSVLIVLSLIIYCVTVFAQYNFYIYEDAYHTLIRKNDLLNQFIMHVYHGRYISNFFTAFLGSVLPKLFNIHPYIFFNAPYGGAGFKALSLFCLFYLMNLFLYNKRKKDFLFPVIIFSLYVWYQNIFAYTTQDIEYCSFLGFIFPFIFFCLFWLKFINIFQIPSISKKDIILITVYAFLLGISTEFTSIVSFFALLFLFILKRSLIKIFLPPFISLIFAMALYFLNPGFTQHVLHDHAPIFFNLNTLKEELVFVKPFFLSLINVAIHQYGIYLLIIFLLSITVYFLNKKHNEKHSNLFIPLSFIFGTLFFQIFLISDPKLSPDLDYWVFHFDLINQVKILLLIVIFYELNCLQLKNLYKNIFIITVISCTLLNFTADNKYFCTNLLHYGLKSAVNKDIKKYSERYKYEKINLFYIKNYKTLYFIPDNFIFYADIDKQYFIYYYNLPENSVQNIINIENIQKLYDKYLHDGGEPFSETELKECDFQKLLSHSI